MSVSADLFTNYGYRQNTYLSEKPSLKVWHNLNELREKFYLMLKYQVFSKRYLALLLKYFLMTARM